jgi:rubrerythrin
MRPAIFRATEIFDMAIGIEERGIAFYQAALESASAEIAGVLHYLIEQEERHAHLFARMRQELDEDALLPESYPGERKNYIDSFVHDQVFLDPVKALEQFGRVTDALETIRIAIDYERRSILFYSWVMQIVRKSEGMIIGKIIFEEHTHISRLLKLRQEIINDRA